MTRAPALLQADRGPATNDGLDVVKVVWSLTLCQPEEKREVCKVKDG